RCYANHFTKALLEGFSCIFTLQFSIGVPYNLVVGVSKRVQPLPISCLGVKDGCVWRMATLAPRQYYFVVSLFPPRLSLFWIIGIKFIKNSIFIKDLSGCLNSL